MNIDLPGNPGTTAEGGLSGKLSSVATDLAKSGVDLIAMGKVLAGSQTLQPLSGPVQFVGQSLADLGQKLAQSLGGEATELPSASTGDGSTDGGEGGSSEFQQQLDERRAAWEKYFSDISGMDNRFTADSLKNLALQVGETILGSKKMAKVRKAIAIAEVIRSRAEAVMTAAKSAPFPLNLPAIAFAAATGQAQQAIVAQAHGGLDRVPSTGTYFLEKGERVVGSRLNKDLSNFLTASNQALTGDTVDRSITRSSTFNPTINLTVGGGTGDDMLLANRGAIETMIREIYADYALQSPFGA